MADRVLEVKITGDTSDLSRALGSATKDADSFGSKLGGAATTALKGIGIGAAVAGVAVVGGLHSALNAAGDFEQKLNVLKSVTGGTNDEMARASKLAIALGNDAKLPAVSAGDAADAMLQLGKAGFTMRQSMDAARGTLLLATAAETDAGLAAKTVTQNINAFGLKAKDTGKIVDQMAGFMNTTGTSFDAFTDSLSYVAAPAHTVGQSFKDTAAQLAILSKNGIEGSMAGTGLRQMLVRLGSANSAAGARLKELGVNVLDSNGKFIGIRGTIEKLAPVLDNMTSAQRLGLMKELFGQTAMNQANILLGTSVEKYDAVTKAIGRKGQADELAAAHMKGYKGAMGQLQSSLETLQIEIGLKLLPVATKFALWLSEEIPVATAIVTKVIGKMTDAWDDHRVQVQKAMDAIVGAWNNDLHPAFNQIQAVVKVLAGFIEDNWGTIEQIIKGAMTVITGVIDVAMGLITGDWGRAWNGIKEIFTGAWNEVVGLLKLQVAVLAAVAGAIGSAILNAITGALSGLAGAITNLLVGVGTAIVNAHVAVALAAVNLGKAIVDGVINAVTGIGGKVLDVVNNIATAIDGFIDNARSAALRVGEGIVSGAVGGVAGIGGKVLGVVNDIIPSVIGLIDNATNAAERIGRGIVSGVHIGLTGIGGKALGVINNVIDEVNQVAQDIWNDAERIGERIVSGAIAGLSGLASMIRSAAESAIKKGLSNLNPFSPVEHGGEMFIGQPIAAGALSGVTRGLRALTPTIEAELRTNLTSVDTGPKVVSPIGSWGGRGDTYISIYQQPGESTDTLLQRLQQQLRTG